MSRDQFTHTIVNGHLHIIRNDEQPIITPIAQPDFGPFTGTGTFTYGSPECVLPYLDLLDWVAVLPTSGLAIADGIRARGCPVMIWETGQGELFGQSAVVVFAAAGYIGQAESHDQLFGTSRIADGLKVPAALVTNVGGIDMLPSWTILTEVYENANPQASILGLDYEARKRGATKILPCFGMYHEGDEGSSSYVKALPLSHYLDELDQLPPAMHTLLGNPPSFSFWIAEQLTDDDWQALRTWRQAHAKVAA